MAHLPLPDLRKSVQISDFRILAGPGIYFLMLDDVVVYVGQAVNMRVRVAAHIGEGTKEFDRVAFVPCHPQNLLRYERSYIEKLVPKYNHAIAHGLRVAGVTSANAGKLIPGPKRRVRLHRSNRRIEVPTLA